MMRILVAYDDSPSADTALALVGSLPLPDDTRVRVLSVVEAVVSPVPGAWVRAGAIESDIIAMTEAHIRERNAAATERLGGRPWTVEGSVIRGRPATEILDEAERFGADLIVMGTRGQGAIASLVLGSVSSEVVDHARSPVLIARNTSVSTVVFATDDSPAARAAESLLATEPTFEPLPIHVVSVADVALPMAAGIAPTMYTQVLEAYADERREAMDLHERIAQEAAGRLREAGRNADAELRDGDAATEIVSVADERGADLIVMGSRGQTGLKRLLLGSVARNVVVGTKASVLVVHAGRGEV